MLAEGCEPIPVRLDGLQLDESRRLQRVIWAGQRILWFFCACLVVAALTGATGRGGYLSEREVSAAAASAILPRIARRGAVARIEVTFLRGAPDHRLLLPHDLLARFEVEAVTPRPVAEMATAEGTLLFIAASGPAPHRVTLHLRAVRAAWGTVQVTADGAVLRSGLTILP
jgi:hypothetical protein